MISCFEALTDCGLGDAYVTGLIVLGLGFILPVSIAICSVWIKFHNKPKLEKVE